MSNLLEHQRQRLEEIDALEGAICRRFQRNPGLLPKSLLPPNNNLVPNKRQKPWNECMQQSHELKYFAERSVAQGKEIKKVKETLAQEAIEELKAMDDADQTFISFDKQLYALKNKTETLKEQKGDDFKSLYAMYSSTPKDEWVPVSASIRKTKKKYILSEGASHIRLNEIFSFEESFGRYLDLRQFHAWYRVAVDPETTYTEYLSHWWVFPYQKAAKNKEYGQYLSDLHEYLVEFWSKIHPLETIPDEVKINANSLPKVGEDGKVFCSPCNKWFSKESVYVGHLGGKKHLLNVSKRKVDVGGLESKILLLASKYLEKEGKATITYHERIPLITEREKELETINNEGYGSEYTTVDEEQSDFEAKDMEPSDIEDDDDDLNGKDLPLGPDGRPMPFWLYRLQGLHRSFECEICGNVSYKGRLTFEKHFNSAKHQQGLRFLGITEDSLLLFKNITLITEANDLWNGIKKEKRTRDIELDNAVEVEDNEGNVMSSKDYEDLKRQGLL